MSDTSSKVPAPLTVSSLWSLDWWLFLYLTGVAVVLCVEINVVRVDRLHPRSLLTPFTDDVVLTGGDRRAYTGQATAQRNKGFEEIDVDFHPPSQ